QCLIGVLIAGLIGLAWYGVGDTIVRHVDTPSDGGAVDDAVLRVAELSLVGAGAWSLIWFFLGAAPLYRPSVAGLALLVGLVLASRAFISLRVTAAGVARAFGWGALGL